MLLGSGVWDVHAAGVCGLVCARRADWVPRERFVDLRCFFRGGAKTVLLLKRIKSSNVTVVAADLARYFKPKPET